MNPSKTLSRTAKSAAVKSNLEKSLKAKKDRILELQRKIEQRQLEQESSDNFMNQYPEEQRTKLRERLSKYRKAIGQPDASSGNLVELTKSFFRQKRDELRDIDAQIADAKARMARAQSNLARTKRLLKQLRLPSLEASVLDMKYKDCIDINSKLLDFLRKIEFHKDDIKKSQEETKSLRQEIKTLTPVPQTLKRAPQRKSAVSVKSSPEMLGATNYESVRMKMAMKSCSGVFQKARGAGTRLNVVIREIQKSLNQTSTKIKKVSGKTQKPLPKSTARELSLKDMRSGFAKDKKVRDNLISETRKMQGDLDTILTDIPEIRTKSPEGLLLWREHLLRHQLDQRQKFESDIARAQAQLRDAQIIKKTRVNSLAKKQGRPDMAKILAKDDE